MQPVKFAVICPVFNSAAHIRPFVEGFRNQSYAYFTIYFVDDGSTDGTVEELRSIQKEGLLSIVVLSHSQNLGAGAARNTAIHEALADGADLLLLMDVDCRVRKDTVMKHIHAHYLRPECLMIGGAIQGQGKSYIAKSDGFGSWFSGIPFSKSGYVEKLHLSSTNLSLKRSAITSVGIFDEELKTGEDVAYCRRFQRLRLPIWFQSDVIVDHLDREDWLSARAHHYKWGLHSYTLSQREHGGYYGFLTKIPGGLLPLLLIPVFALLHTAFIVCRFLRRRPSVLWYLPGIFYLKWWNAVGVYRGVVEPQLCRNGIRRAVAA